MDLAGLGEAGQQKLKASWGLISRVGGVGGIVARQLAAAGVGKLVLATGGFLKHADLNRQLLQADLIVDAAPLFEERFALNSAAVAARKPIWPQSKR
jgi:molybdopterin/thiamine biosynthesis adenylyltransferase